MKVHLVFAPPFAASRYEVLAENMWPPLGVLYLAGYLREHQPDVELRVTDGCRIGYAAALAEVREFAADVVGISFYTTVAHGAMTLASAVKRALPGTLVVMGGPHATALPKETLEASGADLVVVGEGEDAFERVVRTLKGGGGVEACRDMDGVWGRVGDEVFSNPPSKFIDPIDRIPFPARDLIDMGSYNGWFLSKQQPETVMLFARGCPYRCTFCSNAVWKSSTPTLRLRDPKSIVDEMEALHREFGICEVFDNSDEFNNSYPQALRICEEIKRRNLKMSWKAQLRAKPFTDELAQAMAEAGCWYVHLGVETGNQETIDGIEKHITLADVEETCAILKRHGIKVLALFMLFNVWEKDGELAFEDEKATERTLAFAWSLVKRNLVDYISWSVTTPYPGSRLWDIAQRHGLIGLAYRNDWEAWQKDGLFMMDLPGVDRRARGRIKRKGEIVRIRCMLKNLDFKLKDVPFLVKRGLHVLARTFERD